MTVIHKLSGTTLILGGARSGKSTYAEMLVLSSGLKPVYIATSQAHDNEMAERINTHQLRRGTNWTTIEQPLALSDAILAHSKPENAVLVDCLTLWLSNIMMANRHVEAEITNLASQLPKLTGPLILVSNEVGMGLVPDTPLGRDFRDHQGRLNQIIANAVDTVTFIAAGLPLTLKASEKD